MAKGKYQEWLEEDKLLLVTAWARDGLSEEQIAHNMGIRRETLNVWKNSYPLISNALKKGKEVVDIEVENALHLSAVGHTRTVRKAVKLKTEKQVPGKGKIVEERIEYADEEVYIPPSNVAQIFWLKNRKPDRWSDKPVTTEVTVSADDGLLDALKGLSSELIDDNDFIEDEEEESNGE